MEVRTVGANFPDMRRRTGKVGPMKTEKRAVWGPCQTPLRTAEIENLANLRAVEIDVENSFLSGISDFGTVVGESGVIDGDVAHTVGSAADGGHDPDRQRRRTRIKRTEGKLGTVRGNAQNPGVGKWNRNRLRFAAGDWHLRKIPFVATTKQKEKADAVGVQATVEVGARRGRERHYPDNVRIGNWAENEPNEKGEGKEERE